MQESKSVRSTRPPLQYLTTNARTGLDSQTRANAMSFHPPAPISTTATDHAATLNNPVEPTTTSFQLPYLITRTPSAQLPIYEHAKGGGTKHITVVRKLSGDLGALQSHLRDALGLGEGFIDTKGRKKEYVSVNWTTRQVVIRGWRAAEVKRWCELAGF